MAKIAKYITISRDITDNELWSDMPFARGQAWVDLLISANFSDQTIWVKGRPIDVKRGQTIMAMKTMEKRWGWSNRKVSLFFSHLERTGKIAYQKTNVTTFTTILNYDKYQLNASQTHRESIINSPRTHTSKNVKNVKNDKKKEKSAFPFPQEYPVDEWYSFETKLKSVNPDLDLKQIIGFKKKSFSVFKAGKSLEGFFDFELEKNTKREIKLPEGVTVNDFKRLIEHREKLKQPVDNRALYKLSIKMLKFQKDGYNVQSMIEETVDKNWKGLFPKEEHLRKTQT